MERGKEPVGREFRLHFDHGVLVPGLVGHWHRRRLEPARYPQDTHTAPREVAESGLQSLAGRSIGRVTEICAGAYENCTPVGIFHQRYPPTPCDLWDNALALMYSKRGVD